MCVTNDGLGKFTRLFYNVEFEEVQVVQSLLVYEKISVVFHDKRKYYFSRN